MRVKFDYLVEVSHCLHRAIEVVVRQRAVEVGDDVGRVVANRHIEVGQRLLVATLVHQERASCRITHRVLAVCAYRPVEVLVRFECILKIEIGGASVDIGIGHKVLKADIHIEVGNRLLELLTLEIGHSTAVIGSGNIGAQVYRLGKVVERIIVVAECCASNCAILIGGGIDRVERDSRGKIGLRTQQVVEIILGDTAQEICLIRLGVKAEEHIEGLDSLAVTVVDKILTTHIVEELLVVLRVCLVNKQPQSECKCQQKFAHKNPISVG